MLHNRTVCREAGPREFKFVKGVKAMASKQGGRSKGVEAMGYLDTPGRTRGKVLRCLCVRERECV